MRCERFGGADGGDKIRAGSCLPTDDEGQCRVKFAGSLWHRPDKRARGAAAVRTRLSASMQKVKDFVKRCNDVRKRPRGNEDGPFKEVANIATPPKKKQRHSARRTGTPEKCNVNNTITAKDFSGKPLDGTKDWTKTTPEGPSKQTPAAGI